MNGVHDEAAPESGAASLVSGSEIEASKVGRESAASSAGGDAKAASTLGEMEADESNDPPSLEKPVVGTENEGDVAIGDESPGATVNGSPMQAVHAETMTR